MTDQDDEFDQPLCSHRTLTPEQRDMLMRRAIARARAYRAEAIRMVFRRFVRWISRRIAIAKLQSHDDRMLKDIGLHRSEIEAAVRGPERSPGAVTSFEHIRRGKPPARAQPGNGHVGRAA